MCHIHPHAGAAEAAAERAAACQSREEAERAAAEAGGDGAAERWEDALAESKAAQVELEAAVKKEKRARTYDEMTSSVEAWTEAVTPCGKESYPELSIIGAGEFQTYKRRCIFGDCEKRIWRGSEACSFERVFGAPCPTEANEEATEWRGWEKRLRGVNEEGKSGSMLDVKNGGNAAGGGLTDRLKALEHEILALRQVRARAFVATHSEG